MATLLGGRKRWIAYGALMLLSLGMLISFSEVYLVSTAKFGAFRALLGFFAGVFCWRAWASLEDRADSLGGSRFWTCVEAADVRFFWGGDVKRDGKREWECVRVYVCAETCT